MRKLYLLALLSSLVLFISSNYTNSQTLNDSTKTSAAISDTTQITGEVGKIFTTAEADSLFGHVLKADTIKTEVLAKLAEKTPKYIMFNLIEGKACILNAARAVISETEQTIKPEQEFRVLSTSKVLELIKRGGSDITIVETREKALILTNGATVLEETMPCPPICR